MKQIQIQMENNMIFLIIIFYLKENIQKEKEMEKEKNIIKTE